MKRNIKNDMDELKIDLTNLAFHDIVVQYCWDSIGETFKAGEIRYKSLDVYVSGKFSIFYKRLGDLLGWEDSRYINDLLGREKVKDIIEGEFEIRKGWAGDDEKKKYLFNQLQAIILEREGLST